MTEAEKLDHDIDNCPGCAQYRKIVSSDKNIKRFVRSLERIMRAEKELRLKPHKIIFDKMVCVPNKWMIFEELQAKERTEEEIGHVFIMPPHEPLAPALVELIENKEKLREEIMAHIGEDNGLEDD
jgi:hypothetical protein